MWHLTSTGSSENKTNVKWTVAEFFYGEIYIFIIIISRKWSITSSHKYYKPHAHTHTCHMPLPNSRTFIPQRIIISFRDWKYERFSSRVAVPSSDSVSEMVHSLISLSEPKVLTINNNNNRMWQWWTVTIRKHTRVWMHQMAHMEIWTTLAISYRLRDRNCELVSYYRFKFQEAQQKT